jgi:hypothetical protein
MHKRRGKHSKKNAAPPPDDGKRLARSDGQKLYLRKHDGDREMAQDWAGPAGAHHALIEWSDSTHVYTVRYETKISVFDEAGALLGEPIIDEHWD